MIHLQRLCTIPAVEDESAHNIIIKAKQEKSRQMRLQHLSSCVLSDAQASTPAKEQPLDLKFESMTSPNRSVILTYGSFFCRFPKCALFNSYNTCS